MTEVVSHMWLDSDELEQADPVFFDADEELSYELLRAVAEGRRLVMSGSVAADLDAGGVDMPLSDWVRFEPETLEQAFQLRGGATPDVMLADFMGPVAGVDSDTVDFIVRAASATPTPFKGVTARPASFSSPGFEGEVAAAAEIARSYGLHALVVLGATTPAEVEAAFDAVPADWQGAVFAGVPAYALKSGAFDGMADRSRDGRVVAAWGLDRSAGDHAGPGTRCWIASDTDRSIDIARFSLAHFV